MVLHVSSPWDPPTLTPSVCVGFGLFWFCSWTHHPTQLFKRLTTSNSCSESTHTSIMRQEEIFKCNRLTGNTQTSFQCCVAAQLVTKTTHWKDCASWKWWQAKSHFSKWYHSDKIRIIPWRALHMFYTGCKILVFEWHGKILWIKLLICVKSPSKPLFGVYSPLIYRSKSICV